MVHTENFVLVDAKKKRGFFMEPKRRISPDLLRISIS
jgi:hypothetical protein